jgi:2-oxoisovalerate dehydrogenase E1 component
MAPLAPYTPARCRPKQARGAAETREALLAGEEAARRKPPAPRDPDQQCLHDLFCKYPQSLLFGEDVAQKGGVYTVTKACTPFGTPGVQHLLDETMILGLAQGYANMGMLPIPEIQYLAYFHNACDQIRGEAASLQFFSNNQYRNPMVVRVAGLGLPEGLRRPFPQRQLDHRAARHPGLVVGCPSAATMR